MVFFFSCKPSFNLQRLIVNVELLKIYYFGILTAVSIQSLKKPALSTTDSRLFTLLSEEAYIDVILKFS